MKNNKGYSLAELLISIAIFSVVMLGIVSIMRNASISYRNENTEVKLQENAQILITQVEELLLDCKTCDVSGAPDQYTITDYEDNSHILRKVGNTVEYSYAGSDFEVLADNVKKLVIDKQTEGDNRCLIDVEMIGYVSGKDNGSREYTYNASKEVVFRNDVEYADYRNSDFLDQATSTTTTSSTDDNTINVILARYQLLNLEAEYDIDPNQPIALTNDDDHNYTFVTPDFTNNTLTPLTGSTSAYFTTSDTGNKNTENTFDCTITAKKNGGGDITLNISTEIVDLVKGDGIIFAPFKATNDGDEKNFFSYVSVSGISLRDMKKYYSTTYNSNIKGGLIIKKGSTTKTSGTGKTIVSNRSNWNGQAPNNFSYGQFSLTSEGQYNNCNNQCNVCLAFDEFSDDKLCVCFGNGLNPAQTVFDSGNFTCEVQLTYPWSTTTKTKNEIFKIYTTGSTLTHYNNN